MVVAAAAVGQQFVRARSARPAASGAQPWAAINFTRDVVLQVWEVMSAPGLLLGELARFAGDRSSGKRMARVRFGWMGRIKVPTHAA